MKSENHNLSMALHTRHQSCVFIINDLELWWERKEHGDVVIEKIMQLVQEFGRKALFIININVHSLLLLHKLTGIQSWAIATIRCSGFDARQLKELIILRHQAGGMQFMADKMHEYQMNSWDFARLFNRYFDLSKGNPGMTINLWLASIRKVSGRTLYLQKPKTADVSFLEKLSREQIYSLLQFIYHIRFSAAKLASILQADEKSLQQQILNLWQSGILVEKFPGIYAINSALHLHIIDKLKEMKLL